MATDSFNRNIPGDINTESLVKAMIAPVAMKKFNPEDSSSNPTLQKLLEILKVNEEMKKTFKDGMNKIEDVSEAMRDNIKDMKDHVNNIQNRIKSLNVEVENKRKAKAPEKKKEFSPDMSIALEKKMAKQMKGNWDEKSNKLFQKVAHEATSGHSLRTHDYTAVKLLQSVDKNIVLLGKIFASEFNRTNKFRTYGEKIKARKLKDLEPSSDADLGGGKESKLKEIEADYKETGRLREAGGKYREVGHLRETGEPIEKKIDRAKPPIADTDSLGIEKTLFVEKLNRQLKRTHHNIGASRDAAVSLKNSLKETAKTLSGKYLSGSERVLDNYYLLSKEQRRHIDQLTAEMKLQAERVALLKGTGIEYEKNKEKLEAIIKKNLPQIAAYESKVNRELGEGIVNRLRRGLESFKNVADKFDLSQFGIAPRFDPMGQFPEMAKQGVKWTKEISAALYETKGITGDVLKGQNQLQKSYHDAGLDVQEMYQATGQLADVYRKQLLKNLRRGIQDQTSWNRLTRSGLATATLIGSDAEATADEFADWYMHLKLTTDQTAIMGRNMQTVQKLTGVTGDNLLGALKSSKEFAQKMRDTGVYTDQVGKSLIQIQAAAKKAGTERLTNEIQKGLSSPGFFLETSDAMRAIMAQAALRGGVSQQLYEGTILQSPDTQKQFVKGLESVLMQWTGGRKLEEIGAGERARLETAFSAFTGGVSMGEFKRTIDSMREGTTTISDRLEALKDEQKGFITKDRRKELEGQIKELENQKRFEDSTKQLQSLMEVNRAVGKARTPEEAKARLEEEATKRFGSEEGMRKAMIDLADQAQIQMKALSEDKGAIEKQRKETEAMIAKEKEGLARATTESEKSKSQASINLLEKALAEIGDITGGVDKRIAEVQQFQKDIAAGKFNKPEEMIEAVQRLSGFMETGTIQERLKGLDPFTKAEAKQNEINLAFQRTVESLLREIASKIGADGLVLANMSSGLAGMGLTLTNIGLGVANLLVGLRQWAFGAKLGADATKLAKVTGALGKFTKVFAVLSPIIGGITGYLEADEVKRSAFEATILGAITGNAKTGSMLASPLGLKKGGKADEALGVLGASANAGLVGAGIGTMILPGWGTAIGAVLGAIAGAIAELYKVATTEGSALGEAIIKAWSYITTGFDYITDKIMVVWKNNLEPVFLMIINDISKIFGGDTFESIGEALERIPWEDIIDTAGAIIGGLEIIIGDIIELVGPVLEGGLKTAWQLAKPIITGLVEFVKGIAEGDWSKILDGALKMFTGTVVSWVLGLPTIVAGALEGLFNKVAKELEGTTGGQLFEILGKSFGILKDAFVFLASAFDLKAFLRGIRTIKNAIEDAFDFVIDTVTNIPKIMLQVMYEAIKQLPLGETILEKVGITQDLIDKTSGTNLKEATKIKRAREFITAEASRTESNPQGYVSWEQAVKNMRDMAQLDHELNESALKEFSKANNIKDLENFYNKLMSEQKAVWDKGDAGAEAWQKAAHEAAGLQKAYEKARKEVEKKEKTERITKDVLNLKSNDIADVGRAADALWQMTKEKGDFKKLDEETKNFMWNKVSVQSGLESKIGKSIFSAGNYDEQKKLWASQQELLAKTLKDSAASGDKTRWFETLRDLELGKKAMYQLDREKFGKMVMASPETALHRKEYEKGQMLMHLDQAEKEASLKRVIGSMTPEELKNATSIPDFKKFTPDDYKKRVSSPITEERYKKELAGKTQDEALKQVRATLGDAWKTDLASQALLQQKPEDQMKFGKDLIEQISKNIDYSKMTYEEYFLALQKIASIEKAIEESQKIKLGETNKTLDKLTEKATTKGSIYTHDTRLVEASHEQITLDKEMITLDKDVLTYLSAIGEELVHIAEMVGNIEKLLSTPKPPAAVGPKPEAVPPATAKPEVAVPPAPAAIEPKPEVKKKPLIEQPISEIKVNEGLATVTTSLRVHRGALGPAAAEHARNKADLENKAALVKQLGIQPEEGTVLESKIEKIGDKEYLRLTKTYKVPEKAIPTEATKAAGIVAGLAPGSGIAGVGGMAALSEVPPPEGKLIPDNKLMPAPPKEVAPAPKAPETPAPPKAPVSDAPWILRTHWKDRGLLKSSKEEIDGIKRAIISNQLLNMMPTLGAEDARHLGKITNEIFEQIQKNPDVSVSDIAPDIIKKHTGKNIMSVGVGKGTGKNRLEDLLQPLPQIEKETLNKGAGLGKPGMPGGGVGKPVAPEGTGLGKSFGESKQEVPAAVLEQWEKDNTEIAMKYGIIKGLGKDKGKSNIEDLLQPLPRTEKESIEKAGIGKGKPKALDIDLVEPPKEPMGTIDYYPFGLPLILNQTEDVMPTAVPNKAETTGVTGSEMAVKNRIVQEMGETPVSATMEQANETMSDVEKNTAETAEYLKEAVGKLTQMINILEGPASARGTIPTVNSESNTKPASPRNYAWFKAALSNPQLGAVRDNGLT